MTIHKDMLSLPAAIILWKRHKKSPPSPPRPVSAGKMDAAEKEEKMPF
jgi:hypothetical protein